MRNMSLRRKLLLGALAVAVVGGVVAVPATSDTAYADIQAVRSTLTGADGKDYWVENHVDTDAVDSTREALADQGKRPEYLVGR